MLKKTHITQNMTKMFMHYISIDFWHIIYIHVFTYPDFIREIG